MKVLLLILLLVSCGKNPEGTAETLILKDTIVCKTHDTCTGSKITCNRENYYSEKWNCTVFMEIEK